MDATKIANFATLGLIASIILWFFSGQEESNVGSALILFGVLLQLAVFARSGRLKLRWVSLLGMVVMMILASAESVYFGEYVFVFVAGFVFSFATLRTGNTNPPE